MNDVESTFLGHTGFYASSLACLIVTAGSHIIKCIVAPNCLVIR